MPIMDIALELKEASYRYPDNEKYVLKDINLKISRGLFYILTGPTGSGKTTLLMLSRGFYKEYGGDFNGDIHIFGQSIKNFDIEELGSKIGIIFQNPATQLHQLRVIDEIMSSPIYQGFPWNECKTRAETIINELLDKNFYYRAPGELSSGEQQKVALAACLAMECEILLLDEPFSFLDAKSTKEILNILLKLKKEGKTIILSTHNLEEVSGYADRIALINSGKLISEGTTEEILYSNELKEILTSPLSIKVAKALIRKRKLEEKVVNWQNLLKKIKIKAKNGEMIENNTKQGSILKFDNISYTYPDGTKGVENISLDIYKGEILGIVGINASGKTTLAKLALGFLKPNKGRIYLLDEDITKLDVSERAKKIGYITQDPMEMLFGDTVLEECAFGPKCLKLENPEQLAKETLNKLGLLRYEKGHPDSLSGGEKRLLTIADILVNNPHVLILDEPEFGLDPKIWRLIVCIIKKLKKEGKTIILITHNLESTIFLCDRIAVMNKGRILSAKDPTRLYKDPRFLQKINLPSLPFLKILKALGKNKKPLSEEKFIASLTDSVEVIK